MTYPNYVSQNPYYPQMQGNMLNPHPNYFANAMLQTYNNQNQQGQQQNITTQPPIMQPNGNVNNSRIIPVSNKEEATAIPVDLINGVPTFFYNKGKNEIYLKQFDVPTGTAIFKTYIETQQPIEDTSTSVPITNINNYEKELHYISDGIDNLHRMQADLKQTIENLRYSTKDEEIIDAEIEPIKTKGKKHA